MQTIFFDGRKPADQRNPGAVAAAKQTLDTIIPKYDEYFAKRVARNP